MTRACPSTSAMQCARIESADLDQIARTLKEDLGAGSCSFNLVCSKGAWWEAER